MGERELNTYLNYFSFFQDALCVSVRMEYSVYPTLLVVPVRKSTGPATMPPSVKCISP